MAQSGSESLSSAEAGNDPGPTNAAPRGFFRKVIDWYTCRPQIDIARKSAAMSPREADLLDRAKAALGAGNQLRELSEPSNRQLAAPHSAALYAEALTWVLWSKRPELPPDRLDELASDVKGLVNVPGIKPEEALEAERLLVIPRLALELAERDEKEQDAAATVLRRAALVAVDARERPRRAVDTLGLIAFARVGLTLLLVGGAIVAAIALRPEKPNLAAGKPWSESSLGYECHPLQNECGGVKTRIFFHTKEEDDPWFRYDLGKKTQFSSMKIENRQDGEGARAVPLIVEVGDDGTHFHEIARQKDDFEIWKPSFPKQNARYVRLRVPRRSILHLENVEVNP